VLGNFYLIAGFALRWRVASADALTPLLSTPAYVTTQALLALRGVIAVMAAGQLTTFADGGRLSSRYLRFVRIRARCDDEQADSSS
jgi:hypothetical protein